MIAQSPRWTSASASPASTRDAGTSRPWFSTLIEVIRRDAARRFSSTQSDDGVLDGHEVSVTEIPCGPVAASCRSCLRCTARRSSSDARGAAARGSRPISSCSSCFTVSTSFARSALVAGASARRRTAHAARAGRSGPRCALRMASTPREWRRAWRQRRPLDGLLGSARASPQARRTTPRSATRDARNNTRRDSMSSAVFSA